MDIGRRIYYDLETGNVIQVTEERSGDVLPTTKNQDFAGYKSLSAWLPEMVGCIELAYDTLREDFRQSRGVRVNIDTLALEFDYINPDDPEAPPVYIPPLTAQVATLQEQLAMVQTAVDDLILGGGF